MSTFVVIAILKNEGKNLKEWLDHYIWQGAQHFYIAENDSNDDTLDILEPYIKNGLVDLIHVKGNREQINSYRYFTNQIQNSKNIPDWILIADGDEFWFGENTLLKNALLQYDDNVHVIYRHWREFGPSIDGFHPNSLRKDLVYRNPQETSPKFIFRTTKIKPEHVWIHEIRDYPAEFQLQETKNIHCHHYYSQSLEYWNLVKVVRGCNDGDLSVYLCGNFFETRSALCIQLDTTLADLVKKFETKSI
jgi:hypothetical protein